MSGPWDDRAAVASLVGYEVDDDDSGTPPAGDTALAGQEWQYAVRRWDSEPPEAWVPVRTAERARRVAAAWAGTAMRRPVTPGPWEPLGTD